ncbi:MAG TPA: hypothetical protein VMT09_08310 [Steroidobacteraceae bacterium]|nr:hypothetical protein [Steroidobacteraceae bacterium]
MRQLTLSRFRAAARRMQLMAAAASACALACTQAPGTAPAAASATASEVRELSVGGARLQVDLGSGDYQAGNEVLIAWVRRSGDIVSAFYGSFPTPRATVELRAMPGVGVQGGSTYANPDALIRVRVGREVSEAQLLSDWVMVHEMTHLALPDVGEQHAWLSEGLATYLEGVERVQAGNRTEEDVWAEELRQMPRGLPQPGDQGLDHTHTWGRTYWGGAMFCLLADVDIRRRTHNARGLEDAVRAIAHASGGLKADWPIGRVLATGDAAVGTKSLEDLYARMKDAPYSPDLVALWRELGVEGDGAVVTLNDRAPLADVRRAIMRGTKPRS